jgi:protein-tyrosine-phosphatase
MKKKLILIICRGNIIRSPFVEAVINRELKKQNLAGLFLAVSRGTQGTAVDPIPVKFPNITFYKNEFRFSKPTLDKFKIDITKRVSKPVDRKLAVRASVILAVDEKNRTALLQLFPDLKNKIFKLSELINKNKDFTDPENVNGFKKYSEILSSLHDTILSGFPKLLALANTTEKN